MIPPVCRFVRVELQQLRQTAEWAGKRARLCLKPHFVCNNEPFCSRWFCHRSSVGFCLCLSASYSSTREKFLTIIHFWNMNVCMVETTIDAFRKSHQRSGWIPSITDVSATLSNKTTYFWTQLSLTQNHVQGLQFIRTIHRNINAANCWPSGIISVIFLHNSLSDECSLGM